MERFLNRKYKFVEADEFFDEYLSAIGKLKFELKSLNIK